MLTCFAISCMCSLFHSCRNFRKSSESHWNEKSNKKTSHIVSTISELNIPFRFAESYFFLFLFISFARYTINLILINKYICTPIFNNKEQYQQQQRQRAAKNVWNQDKKQIYLPEMVSINHQFCVSIEFCVRMEIVYHHNNSFASIHIFTQFPEPFTCTQCKQ